ncbi:MAG: cobalamin B12-binding domain-containing protein [Acidobacteria bacterium]|nr:cobalamin B12-binding domain-containing protein [Acidobacteriota bacterium]
MVEKTMKVYHYNTSPGKRIALNPTAPKTAALFSDNLTSLLVKVQDSLRIGFEAETPPIQSNKQVDFILDAQIYFGQTLAAVFTFTLYDALIQEFNELIQFFQARGLDNYYAIRMLKAWIMALHSLLPTSEAKELSRPLEWLIQYTAEIMSQPKKEYPPLDIDQANFLRLLIENKKNHALEISLSFHKAHSLEMTLDHLFLASLSEIGRYWSENRLTVADEHLASANLLWVAQRFFSTLKYRPTRQPLIAVACVPGDLHSLGAELLVRYLEFHGWSVLFLGASMPGEELLNSLENRRPHAIVISIRMLAFLPAFRNLVQRLREKLPGVKVLAGGPSRLENVLKSLCDGVPKDFAECSALLEQEVSHA